jgi:NAD(P)-dependent dehydrogenase (short-subunit alcohol dehydrogenase family)
MLDDALESRPCALVTGGTAGIGEAIATGLAERGMSVLIVGRDPERGARAVRAMRSAAGHDRVVFLPADLSRMADVERLAAQVSRDRPRLDRLVLCAGVVLGRQTFTPEGVETNFAVNVLGRAVLARRLMGPLAAAGRPGRAARVLVVSGAASGGRVHYEAVSLGRRFNTLAMVSQFCAGNDLLTLELARRFEAAGAPSRVTVTALKVGAVRTGIRSGFPWWMKLLVPLLIDPFVARTPQDIARSAMRLLLEPEFETANGRLFRDILRFRPARPTRHLADPAEGRAFWTFCEDLAARVAAAGAPVGAHGARISA